MNRAATAREVISGEVIDSLPDGRGVVRAAGKAVFVASAIAGERIDFRVRRRRRNFDEAELVTIHRASPDRATPRCEVYGRCGGCSLQHLSPAAQLRLKERSLLDSLERIGGVAPERLLPPIAGPAWGYRRKARLAAKQVAAKGRVLVGFRERHGPFVTDCLRCETLHPVIGERLGELSALLGGLSIANRIPQLEVAIGDAEAVLVLRVLEPPPQADIGRLRAWQAASGVRIYLQPGGPQSMAPLPGDEPVALFYRLPAYGVDIGFQPGDFIQVNARVNELMIDQALRLLQAGPQDLVLDLYCGLGNFSLPLAREAGQVIGVELAPEMVERAAANAARSQLDNARFVSTDLRQPERLPALAELRPSRLLLDPPRSGAAEVLAAVGRWRPARIVYVSCHPGTLARDARRLSEELGYRLEAAGVLDMFPQTSHVESMALFVASG